MQQGEVTQSDKENNIVVGIPNWAVSRLENGRPGMKNVDLPFFLSVVLSSLIIFFQ